MPTPITGEEAAALGVSTLHERMESGQLRFRLRFQDGSSYIRTEAPETVGWENSHLHHTVREVSVVQSGRVILVEERDGRNEIAVLGPDGLFTSTPGVPHNCYFLPGTVVHTVKYGGAADWIAHPPLDVFCRGLDIPALLKEN